MIIVTENLLKKKSLGRSFDSTEDHSKEVFFIVFSAIKKSCCIFLRGNIFVLTIVLTLKTLSLPFFFLCLDKKVRESALSSMVYPLVLTFGSLVNVSVRTLLLGEIIVFRGMFTLHTRNCHPQKDCNSKYFHPLH